MSDEVIEEQEPSTDDGWGDAMAEQAAAEGGETPADDTRGDALAEQAVAGDDVGIEADVAALESLQPEPGATSTESNQTGNLDKILDIPVTLGVEIGSTKIAIRNLLQLNQGSVVELDRLAGEPLDVMVNGTLVAHGEVVVINEKFGIRLTDVISAQERVKKLR